jgi:hypothetical protein
MKKRTSQILGILVLALWSCTTLAWAANYTLTPDEHGHVLKAPDGRQVGRFMTRKPADATLSVDSVCCLYPVLTPSGVPISEFAPSDHKHHRGIFFGWPNVEHGGGKVSDFWGWGKFGPYTNRVITNLSVRLSEADADHAVLAIRNEWLAEGESLIQEATTLSVREKAGAYVLSYELQFTAVVDLVFKETSLGGFCPRVLKSSQTVVSSPKGKVELKMPNPLDPLSAWPDEGWYDFTIPTEGGGQAGMAVVSHPDNGPTRWFNLSKMGILNPCITTHGPVPLKAGKVLRLRFTVVVHDGSAPV